MEVLIKSLENDFFDVDIGSKQLMVDISKDSPEPLGPKPLEIFLASLCACIGVYIKRYLGSSGADLKNISVKVFGDLTKEKPHRFNDLTVQIRLPFDLGGRINAFLRFVHNCPVHNTIASSVKVNFEVVTISAQ